MKNLGLLIGSLVITLVAVVAIAMLFTRKVNAPIVPADPQLVLGNSANVKGNPEAKVTLVEFSDFQCPSCRAIQPLIEEVYSSASDSVKIVYRHFPLRTIHPNALAAAKASQAAGRQNKFFEYHDKLFAVQSEWVEESDPMGKFEQYATELGLNVEQWKKDVADKAIEDIVLKDEADANILGVDSTPTIYVNNVKTDLSDVSSAVSQALAQ